MSLFEWFGESYFPGEIGTVEKRRSWSRNAPRYKVLINLVISVAMIAGFYFLLMIKNERISIETFLIFTAVFIVYCIIAFFVNPKPDYKNIGIYGTPIDHPFRISDDINRFLVILKAMLWPGFFISRSFIEFVVLLKHRRYKDMS